MLPKAVDHSIGKVNKRGKKESCLTRRKGPGAGEQGGQKLRASEKASGSVPTEIIYASSWRG